MGESISFNIRPFLIITLLVAVSPAQFKELGGGNDWVELSDTLWKYRWEQAINDVKPDIVEIVTWNDYGESHYIGTWFLPFGGCNS